MKLIVFNNLSAAHIGSEQDLYELQKEFGAGKRYNISDTAILTDKPRRQAWRLRKDTDWVIYSLGVGEQPAKRVSKSNPLVELRGLYAEYDVGVSEEEIYDALRKVSIKPTFVERTMSTVDASSTRTRWVWIMSRPIHAGQDVLKRFAAEFANENKLSKLLPEYDECSFRDPAKPQTYSGSMYMMGDELLSNEYVDSMLWKVINSGQSAPSRDGKYSLQDVISEIKRRYELPAGDPLAFPGAIYPLPENLGLGSVLHRFWRLGRDGQPADNPSGAKIYNDGCFCLSGSDANKFVPWSEILGSEWIKKNKQKETTHGDISDIYYCKGRYYYELPAGSDRWVCEDEKTVKQHLIISRGINSVRGEGQRYSQLEASLEYIRTNQRVFDVRSQVYYPNGVHTEYRGRYLNINDTKALHPAPTKPVWGEGFPYIAEYLSKLLPHQGSISYPTNPKTGIQSDQLDNFLSHWARAYKAAHYMQPVQGQALILIGERGVGKGLWNELILDKLFGGHVRADELLTGKGSSANFPAHIYKMGVICVDDLPTQLNKTERIAYANRVKSLVANTSHVCSVKMQDNGQVKWIGRISISMNLDSISIANSLSLDVDLTDKLHIFLAAGGKHAKDLGFKFKPSLQENVSTVELEAPNFAAYLLNWIQPDWVEEDSQNRFGMKPYVASEAFKVLKRTSDTEYEVEIIYTYFKELFDANKKLETIDMTVAEILLDMSTKERFQKVAQRYSEVKIGKLLTHIVDTKELPIEFKRKSRRKSYILNRKDYEDGNMD